MTLDKTAKDLFNSTRDISKTMPIIRNYEDRCLHYPIAWGQMSHAEGDATEAIGANSHSEGDTTIASGENSHAGGLRAIARGTTSYAFGTDVDTGEYDGTAIFGDSGGAIVQASGADQFWFRRPISKWLSSCKSRQG